MPAAKPEQPKMISIEELAYSKLLCYAAMQFPAYKIGKMHETLAEYLEAVERGDIMRLIVLAPPRHGKTALVSEFFPAWFLGRNPDKHIISCSYSQTRANDVGRKVRNQLDDRVHRSIFPHCQIADDMKSIQHFSTNQNGEYFSMGVGGSITGRGAHCVGGDTLVLTNRGEIKISEIYNEWNINNQIMAASRVTNHSAIVYRKIIAVSRRDINENIFIISNNTGRDIYSTSDHLFFVYGEGKGWVRADCLEVGDTLDSVREDGSIRFSDVTKIKTIPKSHFPVYDIQVEATHNFFGNGICLHNCFLIDDALKDRASAESVLERKKLQTWYRGVAYTRLMVGGKIVIINCVAGSTMVTMADGSKRKIKDINVGDYVASFSKGKIVPSQVTNWANQGMDDCYTLKTKSGASVTANDRHPFLIKRNGKTLWMKLKNIQVSDVIFRVNGESGKIKSQPLDTFEIAPDIVTKIDVSPREDVFDIEVAGTENFIANGLISHNTRWHEDDLSGWLLREHASEGWVVLNMPAIAEDNDMLGRKRGEVLWPEAYPLKTLETIKTAIGSYEWNSQYQQRPVSAEGSIIKHEWLRKYDSAKLPSFQKIVLSCDTAFKATELADPTAILVWGVTKTEYYLLDVLCRRMEFHELKNTIATMYQKWAASACLVEDRSSGQSLIQEFKRISPIPVIPIKTMNIDKVTRFSSVSHYFEGGNVLLPMSAPWLVDYETQITTFPYDKHDDMVDATSQFLLWCAKPRYTFTMKPLFWK